MAENMTDFHILLTSNSSVKAFPFSTSDHFQTKLARPITLNDEWECYLSEATISGKYLTSQPGYSEFYSIQNEIKVETETFLPKFNILVYNNDGVAFVAGFNVHQFNFKSFHRSSISIYLNKNQVKIGMGLDYHTSKRKSAVKTFTCRSKQRLFNCS
ncbi:uncharacterized protein TNCT_41181 [Trichonephila clavata]|uniref:Uncharacterized protein n=1 Tax=Trichonephila clavata TaxID=2740835 RepID=A0A8X6GRM4_TRICU|nr:uncharacterized protein TNCT_41181 [Trichonephila clavata]